MYYNSFLRRDEADDVDKLNVISFFPWPRCRQSLFRNETRDCRLSAAGLDEVGPVMYGI